MPNITLAVETNVSRAPQLSGERLLNIFTERQAAEAKSQAPLFGAPGITQFTNENFSTALPTSPSRGCILFENNALFVQGDELWAVRADGSCYLQGDGIGGTQPVSMASNNLQICIVNGLNGWTFDFTNGLQQITDPAFMPARTVSFMDGYFLFDRRDFNEWFISNLYDGRTYNALWFATAEGAPGQVIAVWQNLQLVFVFCTEHIEIWYDAGTVTFPFARYTGGIIPYGTISPFSIVKTDGALFFLGSDHIFYRLQANVPIRISTHAIERLIEIEPDITKAECFTFTVQGHKMIVLTLPVSQVTVCYDISTGKWHERDSIDGDFNVLGRWRARNAVLAYDNWLVGDAYNGNIGVIDWSTWTEYGVPMHGTICTINQHSDRHRLFCSRLELDIEAGMGTANGAASDPQITAARSVDGGRTYGLPVVPRSQGKQGEYGKRLRWLRQGQGRQLMYRFDMQGPTVPTIIGGHADIEPGDA